MTRKALGGYIAHARESLDMTQVELAEKVDVSVGQVSKWERGLSLPSARKLGRIAGALQVDKAELYDLHADAKDDDLAAARSETGELRAALAEALAVVAQFTETYGQFHAEYQRMGIQINQLVEEIAEIKRAVLPPPHRRGRP